MRLRRQADGSSVASPHGDQHRARAYRAIDELVPLLKPRPGQRELPQAVLDQRVDASLIHHEVRVVTGDDARQMGDQCIQVGRIASASRQLDILALARKPG